MKVLSNLIESFVRGALFLIVACCALVLLLTIAYWNVWVGASIVLVGLCIVLGYGSKKG